MRLRRVYVPNFRNLKDVELTFEPDLQPQVFPIGSENGGGKSTLLQLIFCLLHCSLDEKRQPYLSNLIESGITLIPPELLQSEYRLADIELDLDHGFPNAKLCYFLVPSLYFPELEMSINELQSLHLKLFETGSKITNIKNSISYWKRGGDEQSSNYDRTRGIQALSKKLEEQERISEETSLQIKKVTSEVEIRVFGLKEQGIKYLFQLKPTTIDNTFFFCCRFPKNLYNDVNTILIQASENIYLSGPPFQPYLFLNKEVKQIMLYGTSMSLGGNYISHMAKVKDTLPNLYVIHNYSTINVVLQAFRDAMDKDREEALMTGEYGEAYKNFSKQLDALMGKEKQICASPKLSSILVRQTTDNHSILELNPEDLSHGELKRVGLYAWLYKVQNAIVLIDEIENGLHPDWQYRIVNDLVEWGDNQYILATHSFYLCEALTPKHVKEIQPKLQKPNH